MWDQNFRLGMIRSSPNSWPGRRPKCLLNLVVLLILLKVESNAQRPNLNNVGEFTRSVTSTTRIAHGEGRDEVVTNPMVTRVPLFNIVSCLIEGTKLIPGDILVTLLDFEDNTVSNCTEHGPNMHARLQSSRRPLSQR